MNLVTVRNHTRQTLVGDRVAIADTSLTRLVGLLGRRSLPCGEGLWIRPSSGVHTMGMRFPIDVIGLDKNMQVIKLWNRLVPYRVTSVSLALRSVIELPPGQIEASNIQLGDTLSIS